MTTVIHFGRPHALVPKAHRQDGMTVWPIADLVPRTANAWLNELVKDKPYESIALSLWAHQPSLRQATERLGGYLTPMWPNTGGDSLWGVTVETAVRKVTESIHRGENHEGRVVGIYLYWLSQCVAEVARVAVYGINKNGNRIRWTYFEEPLHDWARKRGIVRVEAILEEGEPTAEVIAGLRTHLVARITNPVEAGYLEMYAHRG